MNEERYTVSGKISAQSDCVVAFAKGYGHLPASHALQIELKFPLKRHSTAEFRLNLNPQLIPHCIHALLYILTHSNGFPPLSGGFTLPFVGGIETDLRTQTSDR